MIPEENKVFTATLTLLPDDQARFLNPVIVAPDIATVTIMDDGKYPAHLLCRKTLFKRGSVIIAPGWQIELLDFSMKYGVEWKWSRIASFPGPRKGGRRTCTYSVDSIHIYIGIHGTLYNL